jgi:hypothetical protein
LRRCRWGVCGSPRVTRVLNSAAACSAVEPTVEPTDESTRAVCVKPHPGRCR